MATLASAPARLAGSAVLGVQSDERLAELAAAGHERAFEALVQRYRRPLLRYCSRILPASRAEDAVQQTFLNAHSALARDDQPLDVKPWLYRIARNASLNMLRQNGWNHEQIPLDFDGVRRPDQVVEQRIELESTVAAVGALPDRQRAALVMHEFEGRSYREIAAVLGGGDGAVRQLLNRARVTLRTAASALTPPPVLERVAAAAPGDGSRAGRLAELFGGMGAAGVAKAGATALVAGTLVVGAVNAPLPIGGRDHSPSAHRSNHAKVANAHGSPAPATTSVRDSVAGRQGRGADHGHGTHGKSAPGAAGRHDRSDDHSRAGGHRTAGSGERSGSDDRSGSREPSGSGDHSGSGEHSGSGTPGTPGSDDGLTSGSGSGGSTTVSGDSGSGSSGSGEVSTSGTSDSTGTSGTSGTSDSGASTTSDTSSTSTTSGTGSTSGTSGSGDMHTSDSTSGSTSSGSTSGSSGDPYH